MGDEPRGGSWPGGGLGRNVLWLRSADRLAWRWVLASDRRAFPDTLVILSTRSAGDWYRSAAATIFHLDEDPLLSDAWRERFGFGDRHNDRGDDPEAMMALSERQLEVKVRR